MGDPDTESLTSDISPFGLAAGQKALLSLSQNVQRLQHATALRDRKLQAWLERGLQEVEGRARNALREGAREVGERLAALEERVAKLERAEGNGAGPAATEPAATGPAAMGSAAMGPAVTGPAVTGPAVTGPAVTGPAVTGPAVTGPAVTGSAVTGPAVTGPAVTGPAAMGPAAMGPAAMGPAVTGPAAMGPVATEGEVPTQQLQPVSVGGFPGAGWMPGFFPQPAMGFPGGGYSHNASAGGPGSLGGQMGGFLQQPGVGSAARFGAVGGYPAPGGGFVGGYPLPVGGPFGGGVAEQGPALVAAARDGRLDALQALLAQGADPNARDAQGRTALHAAAQLNHEAGVRALVAAGARKDAADAHGRLPFDLASADAVRSLLCC